MIIPFVFSYFHPVFTAIVISATGSLAWWKVGAEQMVAVIPTFFIAYILVYTSRWASLQIPFWRRRVAPTGQFEGIWLQKTSIPARPFALMRIFFSKEKDDFFAQGWALDERDPSALGAIWNAGAVHYEPDTQQLLFYSTEARVGEGRPFTLGLLTKLSGWGSHTVFRGEICDVYSQEAKTPDGNSILEGSLPVFGFRVTEMRRVQSNVVKRISRNGAIETDADAMELLKILTPTP
jgi:hypothetical protein